MSSSSTHPSPDAASARGNAALGAFGAALVVVWAVLIVYVVYPVLPYSSLRLPGARALNTLVWAPQGWAFFTRNPREEKQFVYGRGPGGWRPVLLAPHARLRNTLGLDRKSRAQGVEMALLVAGPPADAWVPCEGPVPACLERLPRGVPVRSGVPNPTMCGAVAVVLREPVPWAWLKADEPIEMPSSILPLEVAC